MNRRLLLLLPLVIACHREPVAPPRGSAQHGKELIAQYGCNVCHIAPGIEGPNGMLGPSFEGVAARPTVSHGTIQNTPENLERFIQGPTAMNPASAMPNLNVNPHDAQDIVAYLETLR